MKHLGIGGWIAGNDAFFFREFVNIGRNQCGEICFGFIFCFGGPIEFAISKTNKLSQLWS